MTKKLRITIVAISVALFGLIGSPAYARHTCGLEDVPIVGPVCDGYHDPKFVIQYLVFCVLSPTNCL